LIEKLLKLSDFILKTRTNIIRKMDVLLSLMFIIFLTLLADIFLSCLSMNSDNIFNIFQKQDLSHFASQVNVTMFRYTWKQVKNTE